MRIQNQAWHGELIARSTVIFANPRRVRGGSSNHVEIRGDRIRNSSSQAKGFSSCSGKKLDERIRELLEQLEAIDQSEHR